MLALRPYSRVSHMTRLIRASQRAHARSWLHDVRMLRQASDALHLLMATATCASQQTLFRQSWRAGDTLKVQISIEGPWALPTRQTLPKMAGKREAAFEHGCCCEKEQRCGTDCLGPTQINRLRCASLSTPSEETRIARHTRWSCNNRFTHLGHHPRRACCARRACEHLKQTNPCPAGGVSGG